MIETKDINRLARIIAKRIRRQYQPSRVILFGSYAQGNPGRDSDIDILVVGQNRLSMESTYRLQRDFLQELSVPVQIIWMSDEEFSETKDVIGGIAYPASKYGRTLYEKS